MKKVISYIFSFFLAFFLFLLTVMSVLRFTAAGETYFLSQLNQTNYYESAVEGYNRLLKQNARPTNFPVELFDHYVQTKDVIDEMKESVRAGFHGTSYEINTEAFEHKMKNTTDTYIKENNIVLDDRTEDAVNTFIEANVQNYAKLLKFPYMDILSRGITLFHKVYWIAAGVLGGLSALLVFGQMRLHRSRKRKKRWLAYSFIGAGLMSGTIPMILLLQNTVNRIQVEPEYLYDVITGVLNGSMMIIAVCSVLWVLLGFFIAYVKLKTKMSKKNKKQKRQYNQFVQMDWVVKDE